MKPMIILAGLMLGGCATYVPVQTDKLAVPAECKARHYADLAKVEPLKGPTASPDEVNKHWAKHHRLKDRPRYRRLYRDYKVCAHYARSAR
jgi:hypothetical protein